MQAWTEREHAAGKADTRIRSTLAEFLSDEIALPYLLDFMKKWKVGTECAVISRILLTGLTRFCTTSSSGWQLIRSATRRTPSPRVYSEIAVIDAQ